MAIDITVPDHRNRLSKALKKSFTDAEKNRIIRKNLFDIYRDRANPAFEASISPEAQELGTLVNLFQKFVRGHMLTLAYFSPKWDINARTMAGRGLDKRMQQFMGRYTELLNFNRIQKQLALDSAFGWAVAKVTNGIPPKGITAPMAPRVYRVDPDMLIVDPTAATIDECAYIGDVYLVPLNEAQAYPGFNEAKRAKLPEYRHSTSSGANTLPDGSPAVEAYGEPMTRILDLYIPKMGAIYSWSAPNDTFAEVGSEMPMGVRVTPINPYEVLSLLDMPGNLLELSRLRSLRGLHLLSNEMLDKGIQQARGSQRNPVAPLGAQGNLDAAMQAGDNNPIYLDPSEQEKLDLYTIPGPDPSILQLGLTASKLFSSEAGNLEVALGASAGADTARQTEALLGQISASQSLDRRAFEEFLGRLAMKLMTLAFSNDALELQTRERVPGTTLEYSRKWQGPSQMPRVAEIDAFHFSVVPHSTAFRTPQERVGQLDQASQLILRWMMAKAQGAPIALDALMGSVSEAFDLVPELLEWWNGQEPTPAEKTANTYQSMASDPQGSDVRYQGANQQQEAAFPESPPQGGGLS